MTYGSPLRINMLTLEEMSEDAAPRGPSELARPVGALSAATEALMASEAARIGKGLNAAFRNVGLTYDFSTPWEKACKPSFNEPVTEIKLAAE